MLLLFWIEPHMFTKSSSSTPVDLIESGNKNENQKEQRKETHGSESQTKDVYWAIRIVVSSMTIFGFLIFWSFSSYLLKHISVHRSRINENRFNLWLIYVFFFAEFTFVDFILMFIFVYLMNVLPYQNQIIILWNYSLYQYYLSKLYV